MNNNNPVLKDGVCLMCGTHIPGDQTWHRQHDGEHRQIQKDICKPCGEKGHAFWNGTVHAEQGTPAASEGIYPLCPPYTRTGIHYRQLRKAEKGKK